jgi:hypothetical protein
MIVSKNLIASLLVYRFAMPLNDPNKRRNTETPPQPSWMSRFKSMSPRGAVLEGRAGVSDNLVGAQASQAGSNPQDVTRRSTRGSATGTSDDISVAISSSGRMITRGLLSCLQFGPNRHQLLGFVTHVTNLRRPTCLANGTKNGNATFISVQPVTKTSLFSIMKAGFSILVIMMTQKQLNHLWHHIMVPIIHQTVHMVET